MEENKTPSDSRIPKRDPKTDAAELAEFEKQLKEAKALSFEHARSSIEFNEAHVNKARLDEERDVRYEERDIEYREIWRNEVEHVQKWREREVIALESIADILKYLKEKR